MEQFIEVIKEDVELPVDVVRENIEIIDMDPTFFGADTLWELEELANIMPEILLLTFTGEYKWA